MKKDAKAKTPQRARASALTANDLAAVRGGARGTIDPDGSPTTTPDGIQGSG